MRAAIPGVLALIGEAARVDRVNLMETRTRSRTVSRCWSCSEWGAASGVTPIWATPAGLHLR